MRSKIFLGGLLLLAVSLTSCKNEKEELAKQRVDSFVTYSDSLLAVGAAEARANWQQIEADYNRRINELETSLADVKDRAAVDARVETARNNFNSLKSEVQQLEQQAQAAADPRQGLRDSFFGAGILKSDTDFSWVNKDNILKAYQDFYEVYDRNADNYSREELDQIKLIYEALDAHKNKVEKEGLSSSDNMKIAELKVKFAPRFKWDRMTSKSDENAEAKK